MSCPCKISDLFSQCEYCAVTDAKISGVAICDVDYSYCPDYLNSKQKKRRETVRSKDGKIKVSSGKTAVDIKKFLKGAFAAPGGEENGKKE